MKKLSFLFLFVFAAFSACQKDNSPIANEPTNYHVQGITDVIMGNGTSGPTTASLSYTVALVGNIQETVSLSLQGLPAGVYRDTASYYMTPTTGIPTFSASFILVNNGAAPGTYPIKLMCNGNVTGQKYYTFNLNVLPAPPCNASVVKTYTFCRNYCGTSAYYTDVVTADASLGTRIHFSNFANTGISTIYADLDCTTGRITIPYQTIPGDVISGSGTFSTNYMSINYNTSTANCNLTLQ